MKLKHKYLQIITLPLLFLFFFSCSEKGQDDKNHLIVFSGSSGSIQWEVQYPDKEYYYSDLIPLQFKLTKDGKAVIESPNLKQSQIWGDFRIYSSHYSQGMWDLLLQPIKKGSSLLKVPSFASSSSEFSSGIKPVEITIKSSLDGNTHDPSPLMEETAQGKTPFLILVIVLLLLGAAVILFMFWFKKRNQVIKNEEGLKDYLESIRNLQFDANDLIEVYRTLFRLLVKELILIHPGVLNSDSPSELIKHLELPSSLNQWALRSLYPLLETMEAHFFLETPPDRLSDRFQGDILVLNEWVSFTESLETKVKNKK